MWTRDSCRKEYRSRLQKKYFLKMGISQEYKIYPGYRKILESRL